MIEDYVSFEVAKLLKEKGFDSQYSTHFYKNNRLECYMDDKKKYWLKKDEYAAPTIYTAQKWLREEKNIYVEVLYMYNDTWIYDILSISRHDSLGLKAISPVDFTRYEVALQAGILEALKLI